MHRSAASIAARVLPLLVLAASGASLPGCGPAEPPPLAADVSHLGRAILPPLRTSEPTGVDDVVTTSPEQKAEALRAKIDHLQALAEPDRWVAELKTESIELYTQLLEGLERGDPAALAAAAVVLDETPPAAEPAPAESARADAAQDITEPMRALASIRVRLAASAERAAPATDAAVPLDLKVASRPDGGATVSLRNDSGRDLSGSTAVVRLITPMGGVTEAAYHAATWPAGATASARLFTGPGGVPPGAVATADLIEVRLYRGDLRARPARLARPAEGWPAVGP